MIRTAAAIVLAAGLSTAVFAAGPQGPKGASAAAFKAAQTEAKRGPTAKLGPVLTALYKSQTAPAKDQSARGLALSRKVGRLQKLLHATDGSITVDVALTGPAANARAAFESYGLTNISTYGNHISGRVPIAALGTIARNGSVLSVRPALSTTRAGLTTSQGDRAQRTNEVRRVFGLNGAGVKIGALSDSFDCRHTPLTDDPQARFTTAAQDVANGDLPVVQVLKELPEPDCTDVGTDEGRAMLQLMHDVAPGAKLAFHTASVSQTDFAAGIVALANAGAQVIVDDVIYFAEPMFQDGVIAQAVDAVKARGSLSSPRRETTSVSPTRRRTGNPPMSGSRDCGTTSAHENSRTRCRPSLSIPQRSPC
jgi:hypothetical protein